MSDSDGSVTFVGVSGGPITASGEIDVNIAYDGDVESANIDEVKEALAVEQGQQVCVSRESVVDPWTHKAANSDVCVEMRGQKHWIQYWPTGVQAANEFGEVVTLVQFVRPGTVVSMWGVN